MKKYNITTKDMKTNYFHFTNKSNIDSIVDNGLIPNIGYNARNIEKTKKIFFIEGLDNLLILFDCWITALYYIPVIPIIYKLGAFFLRFKWFPNIIGDSYFKIMGVSKLHRKRAFKELNKLLDNGVMLKLDIKDNIDFSYDDYDEIKSGGYISRHLEVCGYSSKYSNLNSPKMDKWNLHTFSNVSVSSDKISLCTLDDNDVSLRDVLYYSLENTKLDLDDLCPELISYLDFIGYERNNNGKK